MIVVLPRHCDGLAPLEETLSSQALAQWITSVQRRQVKVRLPRFKINAGFSLKTALMSLGMRDAFIPDDADFSRLADRDEPLYISAVAHKAFVEVNEEGTEAAAATGVVVAARAMPPPPADFRADHPFLFLIRHDRTGLILFLGHVTNPLVRG
jgi:serpin B